MKPVSNYRAGDSFMQELQTRLSRYLPDLVYAGNGIGVRDNKLLSLVSYGSMEGHDYRTCSRHAKVLRRTGKPVELQIPENLGGSGGSALASPMVWAVKGRARASCQLTKTTTSLPSIVTSLLPHTPIPEDAVLYV